MVVIKNLSNGIPVIFEEIPYLRSVSFGVYIKAGSAFETKENNGISHLIEHMLFKSTKNRTAKQIADEMAYIGGNMNAYTEKESTSFYVTTLEEQLPAAIELIGDMLNHASFLPDELEKEKGVVLEEIDMYDDSPEDLVHEMLQKLAWKGEALGFIISGEKDVVNGFTREELIAFKEKTYTADRMVLSIAGKADVDETMKQLELHFSSFQNSKEPLMLQKPEYAPVVFCRKKDMEQVHLNIAFECVSYQSDEKYILYLLNIILGDGDSSRLFQRLREEEGLTYSIYSYESIYDEAGLFHIDAVLNPAKLKTVLSQMQDVIEEFCENGVTEKELAQAKQLLKTDLIIGNESTKSKIHNNGKTYLMKGYIKTIDEVLEEIYKATCKDVQEFARKYLKWEKKSVSLVGNISEDEIGFLR
ncbi:M16 family metallopeptidase [[Clostridium] polysaccharolyticum]|uniref:Predicted Zn-dependent peptidase n=1 Tax=[Clostridium] polysaccharolyticum TaxID=29364 RepID=A0A1I0AGY7_9FIRM|nr:pitrilysin family protein [[Clostridium] polysaccharolyticum]SES93440.1 Predicted Zn-dependent peptidase [[Clostridium] polysaccharolyticum]